MKLLISAACVCIIVATGFYFNDLYARHRAAAEVAAEITKRAAGDELARKEIFQFAGATDDDVEKVRNWCSNLSENIGKSIDDSSVARNVLHNCRFFGYL